MKMITSIIDYLEDTASKYPYKIAYEDICGSITFSLLVDQARAVGSAVNSIANIQEPVVVFMEKGIHNIAAFLGAVYAGDFYVPIDKDMPVDRINMIIDVLSPAVIIYDHSTEQAVQNIQTNNISLLEFDSAVRHSINSFTLDKITKSIKRTDLLYVLFTSGSTGIPKGVTISHAAVIDLMEWICSKYEIDQNSSFCNQAPFYFDASVPDLFIPLKTGAMTFIPPKSYYTFPKKILNFIIEHEINTLIWVPSALCNVVNCHAFDVCVPRSVKLIIFCGEVMPCRHLNVWKKYVPDARYVNMYGPTEAAYACTYYEIDREFADHDKLPLGKSCENSSILLVTEDGRLAKEGEVGEICILGECLSYGYYNDFEKTEKSFTQNPFNKKWMERMYKTGDLGYIDKMGNLCFFGRKDFQIKRLGYRIELGEIECALLSGKKVEQACCIFVEPANNIIAVYSGKICEEELSSMVKCKVPSYMWPDRYIRLDALPMNINGKIDRLKIRKTYMEGDFYG